MHVKSFAVAVLGLALSFAQFDCSPLPDSGGTSDGSIEPAVVAYLADHLEPDECAQLSRLLAHENTNSKSKENNNGKITLGGQSFACHKALKLWTYGITKPELESTLDGGKEYAQTALKFGLKQIKRNDLVEWMETISRGSLRQEISAMETGREKPAEDEYDYSFKGQNNNERSELNTKAKGRSRNRNLKQHLPTTEADTKDDDDEYSFENLPTSLIYVMIVSGVGMFVIIALGFTTCCCARRKLEQSSRPSSSLSQSYPPPPPAEPIGF